MGQSHRCEGRRVGEQDLARDQLVRDLRNEAQGEEAEASADYEVAIDLYEVARSACLAMGLAESGIRAAWYQGRTLRKLGRLDEALKVYEVAESAAGKLTDKSLVAAIMTGRGHVERIHGNIPVARRTYKEAIRVSPPGALAIPLAYSGLMLTEREVGALASAVKFGLMAFNAYPEDDPDRYGALNTLGNVMLECGELSAAEDAYEIVARAGKRYIDHRAAAANGLARVAARRNDQRAYRRAMRRLESERGKVQVNVWTQILLDRARDELIIGRLDRAREAVDEALGLAEAHKLGRLIIEADEIRAMVDNPKPTPQHPVVTGTSHVGGRLRALRATLTAYSP